jgi:TolB-like protein/AraC-like DNA-binding protein/Tfp pilus assembly protein PilF
MPDSSPIENDFLKKLTQIVEENLSNEKFGVSELANEVAMSRSNLLRKIKKLTNLSVSQFIRQIRLQHAMEMLKQESLSISEISYQVGFSSVSYFIKCFRDFYGFSPGETGKQNIEQTNPQDSKQNYKKNRNILITSLSVIVLLTISYSIYKPNKIIKPALEKSIAVLPFKNDSNDSANVYIVNGLMESLLNKLQKIEGLKVVSRTSVEKYRNNPKTSAEIAKELNVSYFVEGSGQKIGDQIMLNIQLIEANEDKHLWAEQYTREATDIFKLQKEMAKNIVDKIQIIITPEEEKILYEQSTDNLLAYDHFLKGLELMNKGKKESFEEAISYFNRAIDEDPNYARAYASISMCYYFLDLFQADKKHLEQIEHFADKAFLLDAKLPQALIAKALSYNIKGEKEIAITYLEKALQYKPNSALVINFLSDYYANHNPDTEKYLEYALKGIQLDINAQDSVTASFMCLHISNAFIQNGFTNEAESYINKSLGYNSLNLFSQYVKAYILYAKNKDLYETKNLLVSALEKDSTRLDILQEVAKIHYYMRDYKTAYVYYKHFIEARKKYNMNIYAHENAKIAVVFDKMGYKEEANEYLEGYKLETQESKSVYKNLGLAMYYAYKNKTQKAIDQLKLFSIYDNSDYWTILFLRIDPLIDNIKHHPEFNHIMKGIEKKFWKRHKYLKKSLNKKGLLRQHN